MPRTKYNNKNNMKTTQKDEMIAERLREYDTTSEQLITALKARFKRACEDFSSDFKMMKSRFSKNFLQMTLTEVFANCEKPTNPIKIVTFQESQSPIHSKIKKSKEDEGYLTEDSCNKASIKHSSIIKKPVSRSAKVPTRRSRSACTYLIHLKRNSFEKILNVDRGHSPAISRWPKPGEKIISLSGSPIVSSMIPTSIANINIPIRNGMVSLKAKKINALDQKIIQNIEPETIQQIKQLQTNLNYIMISAEKANNKFINME